MESSLLKRAVATTLVCVSFLAAFPSRAAKKKADIVLSRADGNTVTVPMSGALHDPRAETLAREIQTLDAAIRHARASATSGSSSEAQAAMLDVAVESREDAVRELELALAVARLTSAGKLDDESVGKAKDYASQVKAVLSAQAPNSILVATDISTTVPDATLHYMSKGKYNAKSKEWSSYTAGERMRIGRYVFRVQPADAAEVYEEFVLVTSDPTKKRLSPMRANR
jgi:hypothetical protein